MYLHKVQTTFRPHIFTLGILRIAIGILKIAIGTLKKAICISILENIFRAWSLYGPPNLGLDDLLPIKEVGLGLEGFNILHFNAKQKL